VNPSWAGSNISFLSPAIQFATFPVPAGQPTQVKIVIDNLGTMDASPVTLETAYNVYIGNQAATMVGIQNQAIPLIPAGCTHYATVTWTPPDMFIAHACFNARVFDSYSLLHHAARCFSWDPYVNPQAGSHNTILLKVEDPNKAIVVTYPAINTSAVVIRPKLLITVVDDRARFNDLDERFPLPFVPEHLTSTSVLQPSATDAARLYEAGAGPLGANVVTRIPRAEVGGEARGAGMSSGRRWPREDVSERFVHHRFGFDAAQVLNRPGGGPAMRREVFLGEVPRANLQLDSYSHLRLAPGEEQLVCLVIPPAEFPAPGRRKKFQVDYQTGDERPVQNFVYLYA
ncbi:MAG: hypothetical protein JW990_04960, partial [Thermoleophilia bacterium]|nr:hypothetical protein [Thermoleophilia bacterium]